MEAARLGLVFILLYTRIQPNLSLFSFNTANNPYLVQLL